MRVTDTGCLCDDCKKQLNPFEAIKIKRYQTVPGKNYAIVSSDTTTKSKNLLDLCDKCYNERFGDIDGESPEVIKSNSILYINKESVDKLNKYIKTFKIRYSYLANELGLDKSTVPKYFKGTVKMRKTIYYNILSILRKSAQQNQLMLYLIDTWLMEG